MLVCIFSGYVQLHKANYVQKSSYPVIFRPAYAFIITHVFSLIATRECLRSEPAASIPLVSVSPSLDAIPLATRLSHNLGRALDLLERDGRIVGTAEPVEAPVTTGLEVLGETVALAAAADAAVPLAPSVGRGTVLVGARVEHADTATGHLWKEGLEKELERLSYEFRDWPLILKPDGIYSI